MNKNYKEQTSLLFEKKALIFIFNWCKKAPFLTWFDINKVSAYKGWYRIVKV